MLIEMLYLKVVLNLVIIWISFVAVKSSYENPHNEELISSLRNEANLDLPPDDEYEDLRAELLAYHTAFAQLSDSASQRRSMKTTACWHLGGICINYKLCEGYRFLTEVPGCKDGLTVCCFAWNKFYVRDWSDFGYQNMALPWGTRPKEVGKGKGIVEVDPKGEKKKKINKKNTKTDKKKKSIDKKKYDRKAEVESEANSEADNVVKLKTDTKGFPEPVIGAKLSDPEDILEPVGRAQPSAEKVSESEFQEYGLPNLKIYKIAMPSQNEFQRKPILRSLGSSPNIEVANLESE